MFAKKDPRVLRTLTGQLTLIYALLTGVLSVSMVLFLYFILVQALEEKFDDILWAYANFIERLSYEQGLEEVKKELLIPEEGDPDSSSGYIRLIAKDGTIMASSNLKTWPNLTTDQQAFEKLRHQKYYYLTVDYAHRKNPVRLLYWKTNSDYMIQVGYTTQDDRHVINEFATSVIVVSIVLIILSCMIGFYLAKRAMAGVKQVTLTAGSITEGELSARVPESNQPEEIQQLAGTFNRMIDRIESLIKELKVVSNSVAHDLRRPLTSIRGNAEVALRGDTGLEEYKTMTQKVIRDCELLETMINTMLEIAAVDSGIALLKKEKVNLNELLLDAEELFMAVADSEEQFLKIITPKQPIFLTGDRSKLQRVVANLLDNALKFTPAQGKIVAKLQSEGDKIQLLVQDSGPGIAWENHEKIFNPFFREDASRSKPGNGLGLSYVKSIVEKHNGIISVQCPKEGGTIFTIAWES